jgi:hypothetical protein
MRPNFDLAVAAVLYRIGTDPIVDSKKEGLSEGKLAILSQHSKSS